MLFTQRYLCTIVVKIVSLYLEYRLLIFNIISLINIKYMN